MERQGNGNGCGGLARSVTQGKAEEWRRPGAPGGPCGHRGRTSGFLGIVQKNGRTGGAWGLEGPRGQRREPRRARRRNWRFASAGRTSSIYPEFRPPHRWRTEKAAAGKALGGGDHEDLRRLGWWAKGIWARGVRASVKRTAPGREAGGLLRPRWCSGWLASTIGFLKGGGQGRGVG